MNQTNSINYIKEGTNIAIDSEYGDYFDSSFPGWISVLLLIVGVLGNILCLIVLSQKKMRKNSAFVYLAFLSVVDIFVLLLGLGDIVVIAYYRYMIRNQNIIICRVHSFLTYVFTHCSSLILALVSIDRAIATNLINFAKTYCKPSMAIKIICLTLIFTILINFHYLLFLGYEKNEENSTAKIFECGSQTGTLYDKFMDPYFEWIDLILYSILPFIIMLISSYLIIRVLVRSVKRLNKSGFRSKSETLSTKEKGNSASIRLESNPNGTRNQSALINQARINKTKHLSYTLITLNAIFFILISPLVIVLIILKGNKLTEESKILMNSLYMLAYANHSFNFILYGFLSPPFRSSLRALFSRTKQSYITDFKSINNRDMELTSNLVQSRSQYAVNK